MMKPSRRRGVSDRRGHSSIAILILLTAIFLALLVLIVLLVVQGKKREPEPSPVMTPGGPSPSPINDAERIRASLPVGRTFRGVLKAGVQARAEDKHWWHKDLVNLTYLAEVEVERTIEENDGKRLVELRHFVTSRNVKLLCDVESAKIDLGAPGVLLLGALSYVKPHVGAAIVAAKPIADAILRGGAQSVATSEATKAVAHIDTLSGKRVRITYVDGSGVQSVQPVGCVLSEEERNFLFATAPLSDCAILKDVQSKPGDEWTVEGSQLGEMIDPSLRGVPTGEITIGRKEDTERGGKRYALLTIRGGSVEINASDRSQNRIGSFAPEGDLDYSLTDGFVEHAQLKGRFRIERVSKDHILFETHFRTEPKLEVDYSCQIR